MSSRIVLLLVVLAGIATLPAAAQAPGELPTLSPGDLIRLTVYREPELNGEYLVDERGVVNLPLIGDRRVAGVPISVLRDSLEAAYRVEIRNPSISIVPLRRVNVLGEVNKPGMYAVDPTVSLAGAIAMAGGASATGSLGRIRIVRGNQVIRQRVGAAETITSVGIQSNDQILVDRRSWFDRNSQTVVGASVSVASIITGLIIASN
jgi:protein involved in polysaccharide export with SLBB domain